MNKILIEKDSNIVLKENTFLEIANKNINIDISIENDIKVFLLSESSNININIKTVKDLIFNIFSYNSILDVKLDILKDNLNIDYAYSTINEGDNKYNIDINHLGKNIKSIIKNHGINKKGKLDFIVNTIVFKDSDKCETFQDSKIITDDIKSSVIKPNLYIDNDDIEAEHSAYIGRFKEEKIFYLMSRGLDKESSEKLLVNSFLIGNMNLDYEEKDLMLKQIKRFWR